ncbi:hypothetical protein NUSPORA_01605 [Nucleospora cyclopteri]
MFFYIYNIYTTQIRTFNAYTAVGNLPPMSNVYSNNYKPATNYYRTRQVPYSTQNNNDKNSINNEMNILKQNIINENFKNTGEILNMFDLHSKLSTTGSFESNPKIQATIAAYENSKSQIANIKNYFESSKDDQAHKDKTKKLIEKLDYPLNLPKESSVDKYKGILDALEYYDKTYLNNDSASNSVLN